jgi:hypothetical protein
MNGRQQAIESMSQSRDTLSNAYFWLADSLKPALTTNDVAAIKANHFRDAKDAAEVLGVAQ